MRKTLLCKRLYTVERVGAAELARSLKTIESMSRGIVLGDG